MWPISGTAPAVTHLDRLRNAIMYLCQDSWQASQDSNWTPPKYTCKFKVVLSHHLALKKESEDTMLAFTGDSEEDHENYSLGYHLSKNLDCLPMFFITVRAHTAICRSLLIIARVTGMARYIFVSTGE